MRARILGLVVCGAVAGCALPVDNSPSSTYFTVGPEAQLRLDGPVTVPPRSARAYIQDGAVVTQRERNPYHPNCVFTVRSLADAPRVYGPANYRVTGIDRLEDVLALDAPVQLAALDGPRLAMTESDAGHGVNFVTRFHLASPESPEVTRLDCGQWGDAGEDRYLALEQVTRTLGGLASLDIGH